jgi:hypothetical protein
MPLALSVFAVIAYVSVETKLIFFITISSETNQQPFFAYLPCLQLYDPRLHLVALATFLSFLGAELLTREF